MYPIIPIADLPAYVSGQAVSQFDFRGLPDEIGGKPAGCLAVVFDLTIGLNSAAGGAGVTGRNLFDVLHTILIGTGHPAERGMRVRNLFGGNARALMTAMMGIEPIIPSNLAAAGGAATKQIRIIVPMTDFGVERPQDYAAPVGMLKKTGTLSFSYANSPSALGGNANDTITSLSGQVGAMLCPLDEGEVPQPIVIEWMDKNGSQDLVTRAGRFRYALVVAQNQPGTGGTGVNLAAGTISPRLTSLFVGANEVLRNVTARNVVDLFNKDRIKETASKRFAPDDTALGQTDFFPIIWPGAGQDGVDVPYGELHPVFQGSQTNFRLLVVDLPSQDDDQRSAVLQAIGYKSDKVNGVAPALRRPNLLKPLAGGHLNTDAFPARKRGLISQTWHGLTSADRKGG